MKLHPAIIDILRARGIVEEDDIKEFLSDKPQKTYDPFLLPQMEEGVDLILSAVDNGMSICIYGDYDADGVTSVALLCDVLRSIAEDPAQIKYYIPSRFDEGYGLNKNALEKISQIGIDLVVTVDCGSSSPEEVEYAKSLGMEIIVTDHHTLPPVLPNCVLINPMRSDSQYPFRTLAGVGVTFKLCQALIEVTGMEKSIITRNLDLVAIGTIGDLMPLKDENRTLVKYGLRAARLGNRKGTEQLMNLLNKPVESIDSQVVSFNIVPHINASGRMKNAYGAAKLMLASTDEKAAEMASQLVETNKKRRELQEALYSQCLVMIEKDQSLIEPFVFLTLDEAHEGVTGIVAGKLKEKFNRPAIIVTDIGEGVYKGTGRSVDGFDLYRLLKHGEQCFLRFGGHKGACGFSIEKEQIHKLKDIIFEAYDIMIHECEDQLQPAKYWDLSAEMCTLDFAEQLTLLEPFGRENEPPVFRTVIDTEWITPIGAQGQYFKITGVTSDNCKLTVLVFNVPNWLKEEQNSKLRLEVTGTLDINVYNGNKYLQMISKTVTKREREISE